MSSGFLRSIVLGVAATASLTAYAQLPGGGWDICQGGPTSPDYNVSEINDNGGPQIPDDTPLFQTSLGIAGTVQFLHDCVGPGLDPVVVSGRYGFGSGSVGSIQSHVDDYMMYTYGMPDFPGNCFAYSCIVQDGTPDQPATKSLFGSVPFPIFFVGLSDRYMIAEETINSLDVKLNIDVLGDAARYDWLITNTLATPTTIGMWSGAWPSLKPTSGPPAGFITGAAGATRLFIGIPNQRPSILETRWTRIANPTVYPPYVDFDYAQDQPYGLRIETGPSPSTTDPVTLASDATQSDEFELGFQGEVVSPPGLLGRSNDPGPTFPDSMFPFVHNEPGIQRSDLPFIDDPAYVIKYFPTNVAGGGKKEIVQYYRDTWGQSSYASPYTLVVDAPKVFNYDLNGLNNLTPNPATVRVWVDNIKGFSTAEQELPLENVQITLDLRNSPALTFVGGGKVQTKTIAKINSRKINFVDFTVQADGILSGDQSMTVTSVAPPGPVKTLVATTSISTTPRIPVVAGANLVTIPWTFTNSSWDAILGLSEPTQFQAFDWDPVQQGYVLSTSAQRSKGTWLVIEDPSVIPAGNIVLQSNPQRPNDMQPQGPNSPDIVQLKSGWNLIGDPFPYPILLGELVGVSAGDPTKTVSWTDMVDSGFVSGALAYWDTSTSPPGYKFISGNDVMMQPNVGYWIYVNDIGLTLEFPWVFLEGAQTVPSPAAFAKRALAHNWVQSDSQWRLMMAARTTNEIDDQNFIGKAASAQASKMLKIYKPPMTPSQSLGVSIDSDKVGETRLAQSLLSTTGAQQWKVNVLAKKAGEVTLTWPNMNTVPKNVMFRLTDSATNTSRDMRRTSGYTFTAAANSTRVFTIQAQPGTASKAVIGNVVVTQGRGLDRNAPFTISYTLSSSATTTVRILGAGGQEIFTATRGRADVVGENTATWAMRDNANRAVAPGIYRVEITAETSDGQRVRKIVPVNVIR